MSTTRRNFLKNSTLATAAAITSGPTLLTEGHRSSGHTFQPNATAHYEAW